MKIGFQEIGKALQKSALHKKGLCDYVINPAMGCLHGCTFCYVPSTPAIRTNQSFFTENEVDNAQLDWGKYLFVRPNVPEQLAYSLPRKRTWVKTPAGKGVVMLSSGTDPYQNPKIGRITRQVVQTLIEHGKRVRILTRSPLWVRDLDILVNPLVTVGMSIPHLDDELSRKVEPGAPRPSDRLKALIQGHAAGCRTFVAIAPTIPGTTIDQFKEIFRKLNFAEIFFWEPINARGTNGQRMKAAGIDFVDQVMSRDDWARNFLSQWLDIEHAATRLHCLDRLHPWPDKALKGYVVQDRLEHWINRPTLEQWPEQ